VRSDWLKPAELRNTDASMVLGRRRGGGSGRLRYL
jgi:hypothetical protein